MHREDNATNLLYLSSGSVSIAGLRERTYAIDLPASPIPGTSTITLVWYVVSGKSDGGPIGCHANFVWWNTGARANPSAGSVKPATAIAPAPWAVMFMKFRRVTVSPSNAPGILRSAVYLDLG